MSTRTLSAAAFAVLVLLMFALIEQGAIVARGVVGIAVQVAAVALMIWARVTFGGRSFHAAADPTEGGIVTSGPYRYIRHPIYAAALYFIWAAILTHFTAVTLLIGIGATAATAVRIVSEERLVMLRYPEYAAYAAATKRIIPFVL